MFEDLKALAATVEGRSLTAAAERLCVTQSAVSRRLQHLEDVLGASLFDRTQRPPVPNALGRRVYDRALPILAAVDALLALPREDAPPTGTLRLGVTPAIGDTVSAAMIRRVKRDFPALDIRLRTEWGASLTRQVLDGELDAALVLLASAGMAAGALDCRPVAALDLVVVAGRTVARREGPVRLASLAEEEWILNPVGCGYRSGLEAAMGERGGRLRVSVDVYGTEAQLRMVASGLGLGLVPRSVLGASPSRREIAVLDVEDFAMRLEVCLISLGHQGSMRRPVEVFADAVAGNLASADAALA